MVTGKQVSRRFALAVGAIGAAAILAVSVVADALIPPASARMPLTIYVDARIGDDRAPGRTPDEPLATLGEALRRAKPGADILLTGYGDRLTYAGTGTHCVTLVGEPDRPIVIRRNVYTNTLAPAVISADHTVRGGWTRHPDDHGTKEPAGDPGRNAGARDTGHTSDTRHSRGVWSMPWPRRIRLTGDPDVGFVKIGGIALTGYPVRPKASVDEAAWWEGGRVYVRTSRADPNRYPVTVKDGDALCLSGQSRHVRVKDLMVVGAVHAVRTEPDAFDIQVEHLVRENVLDDDRLAHLGSEPTERDLTEPESTEPDPTWRSGSGS
ncbi:MAG: hypothetical protein ACRDP8_02445 [Actinopolymorphaceae bacterium]